MQQRTSLYEDRAPGTLMTKQLFDKLGSEVTLDRFAPD
jgi:hypothetical protein